MTPEEQRRLVEAFWIAVVVSALASWPIYRILLALRSRQTVSEYAPETHRAKQGTPTMGGLIPLVGFFAAWIAVAAPSQAPLAVLVLGFSTIGFLDDFLVPRMKPGARGLGWKPKLALQVAAVALVLWLDGPPSDLLSWTLAGFVILFASNAYNFADGLDGLAGSLGVQLCVGLGAIGVIAGLATVGWAAAALAAGLVTFLFLNAPPARVFMGDVGSLPIGAAFGYLGLELAQIPATMPALGLLALILALELIPVPLQIFWVKVFKKRLFSYTPIHHAFEKAGWPESKVVWTFGLVQFVLTAGAVSLAWLGGGGR